MLHSEQRVYQVTAASNHVLMSITCGSDAIKEVIRLPNHVWTKV